METNGSRIPDERQEVTQQPVHSDKSSNAPKKRHAKSEWKQDDQPNKKPEKEDKSHE